MSVANNASTGAEMRLVVVCLRGFMVPAGYYEAPMTSRRLIPQSKRTENPQSTDELVL
ncbi:MAG: hypothetical protein ACXW06_08130 [Halobacteriota archaeon]